MKITKKSALISLAVLTIWFALNLTGFRIGNFTLVVSAFVDEPVDAFFFVILCMFIFLFIRFEKIGKWLIAVFLIGWAYMQGSMYFRSTDGIKSYNEFFLSEGTHRLLPISESVLIKDTYHIVLDILILAAILATVVAVVDSIRKH